MKKSLFSISGALLFTLLLFPAAHAADQLEQSIEAHGGLETFKKYGTLEYDLDFELTGVTKLNDHQLIDLNSRKIIITGDKYTIGFDGNEAWIAPDAGAMALPARFYSSTPFYFFVLPFVFSDPGANAESLGTKELDGKEYDVVKITYDKGVGDTPDDNYVAYIDKETNRLKLVNYIVTYPPFMQGKSIDELERHAVAYDEWQEVDGLVVPKKISFYVWSDEKLGEGPAGFMIFENVSFKDGSPDSALFSKPEGAEVDNSHMQQ